jgi:hypothetical protein
VLSLVYPTEVFKPANLAGSGSAALLVAHNHRSGDRHGEGLGAPLFRPVRGREGEAVRVASVFPWVIRAGRPLMPPVALEPPKRLLSDQDVEEIRLWMHQASAGP